MNRYLLGLPLLMSAAFLLAYVLGGVILERESNVRFHTGEGRVLSYLTDGLSRETAQGNDLKAAQWARWIGRFPGVRFFQVTDAKGAALFQFGKLPALDGRRSPWRKSIPLAGAARGKVTASFQETRGFSREWGSGAFAVAVFGFAAGWMAMARVRKGHQRIKEGITAFQGTHRKARQWKSGFQRMETLERLRWGALADRMDRQGTALLVFDAGWRVVACSSGFAFREGWEAVPSPGAHLLELPWDPAVGQALAQGRWQTLSFEVFPFGLEKGLTAGWMCFAGGGRTKMDT